MPNPYRGFSEQPWVCLGDKISGVTSSILQDNKSLGWEVNEVAPFCRVVFSMLEEMSDMSQATKEVLLQVRKMVPPMLEKFHKGRPRHIGHHVRHH